MRQELSIEYSSRRHAKMLASIFQMKKSGKLGSSSLTRVILQQSTSNECLKNLTSTTVA